MNYDTSLDGALEYELQQEALRESFEQEALEMGDDCSEYDDEPEPREDHFNSDAEADADTLASAGMGTDEDYGYFGDNDDCGGYED